MGRALAWIGSLATLAYLLFVWWFVGDRLHNLMTMDLNEVGDFLAGVFGPLGILWLVLGFFQQGVELRQGTEALLLQAKELNSSVEQQVAMVEVAKRQLETQILTVEEERRRYERAAEPDIRIECIAASYLDGEEGWDMRISNQAVQCFQLKVVLDVDAANSMMLRVSDYFTSSGSEFFIPAILFESEPRRRITCSYKTSAGKLGAQEFSVIWERRPNSAAHLRVSAG